MKRLLMLIFTMIALTAASCTSSDRTAGEDVSNTTADEDVIDTTGTIQYVELEGGFFGIIADDGTKYDPTNLPDEFHEDGLRVRFRAQMREDAMSFRMWGRIVDVLEMERM